MAQTPVYNGIIYVTPTGAGNRSGDSWANAMSSIDTAQTLAQANNAVVWVAAGTYYGDTLSENAFTMRDGVSVYGGFAGNEPADYDLSLRDFETNATILDGRNARRVLYQPNDFTIQTVWDGFTVQNGNITGNGGGVYLRSNGCLSHCKVQNNTSSYVGGGVCAYSNSTVINCQISNNTSSSDGGGMYASSSTVINCQISNNTSSFDGGGVSASSSTVINCLIGNNSAIHSYSDGGGVYSYNSTIRSSTIVRNTSGGNGGGVFSGTLTNCIVWGNERNGVSDNVYDAICTYSAIEGGYSGMGNVLLSGNEPFLPMFVNPSLTAGASDSTSNVNWHLQQGSVCINRGNNDAVTDSLDLDGSVRIQRDTVDMGCYESDFYSLPLPEFDSIIYVTPTGAGSRSGHNWANATSSIAEAQGLAQMYGAMVWAAAGTYYGDTLSENAFTMYEGVNVYGGFAGNEPVDYNLSLRDFETNATILDGQNARRVLNQPNSFSAQTVWDGFTVQHGNTNGNTTGSGGGVYLRSNGGLSHCKVQNNTSPYSGGGVFAYTNSTVSNCLISNNTSSYYGGGVCAYSNSTVRSSTIVRNTSSYGCGGVYSGTLTNCIVWGNERNGAADNIYDAICTYSAIEGGYSGTGNVLLSGNEPFLPMFVNPSLTAGASDSTSNVDWHLQQGSVCINRGNNEAVTDSLDLDGSARVQRDTVDMGCYESDFYSLPLPEFDSIIYVTPTGAGSRSGRNWANASSSIAEAQGLAQTYNAVVWVAAGTYYGDTTSSNAFTMRDGVSVYGGFAGNEPADYDLSQRDFEANETILDGQNARRVLNQPSSFSTQTVWDGFTVQHGNTTGSGGGVCLEGNGCLSHCKVQNNTSSFLGGGVCASSSTVINCLISNNSARNSSSYGGGVYAYNSTVINCQISNNTSSSDGGGMFASSSTVINCQISNNSAMGSYSDGGGGVYASGSTVSNCQISNNTSFDSGGGVYASNSTVINSQISNNTSFDSYGGGMYASSSTVSNCLVSNNTSSYSGGVYAYNSTVRSSTIVRNTSGGNGGGVYSGTFTNCIVWGNERNGAADNVYDAICAYSAIEGGYEGDSIITLNDVNQPLFVNPSATAGASDSTANVDWHLQNGSVCVNRGDNSAITDSLDLDGTARIKRDTVDMGCYESDFYSLPLSEYDSIIYVTVTGAGTHSGNSWANATSSIDMAQTLAQANNAVVWVAAGTYYGDTTAANAFTMRDGVSVYGGFAGNEPANYDLSLRDFGTNATILDGQATRRVLYQSSNFSTEIVWDGFVIRNGNRSGNGAGAYLRRNAVLRHCAVTGNVSTNGSGGGVYAANALVEDCDIEGNTCRYDGGGVYATSSTVSDCSISGNNTTYTYNGNSYGGGGVYASSSTVTGCQIMNNTSASSGGGVRAYNSTLMNCQVSNNTSNYGGGVYAYSFVTLTNCQVSNNTSNYGGGVYADDIVWLTNCQVSNNTSSSYGGGVDMGSNSQMCNCLVSNNGGGGVSGSGTITNTTIVRNSSPGDGAGVNGRSPTVLRNCIVWGNERNGVPNNINGSSVNCSYCAVEGGYPGTGMVLLDGLTPPLFANPSLSAGAADSTANVDWHLQDGSFCVNRGNNASVTDSLDLDGTARIKRDTVDLGCYESDYYSVPFTEYDSIIYVTQTGSGTRSGNSWANATSSIEEAQALALTHNAVVWVATGTYYGDTTAANAFTMRDGVSVYGGFAGNESADYDLSLRDFETNATILDGQNVRRVLYQPFEFNSRAEWNGFTVRNGSTSGDGAGAYLRRNAVLRQCAVTDNVSTSGSGGGVYAANAVVEECEVVGNTCRLNGGGIHAVSSSVVTGCNIEGNTTTYGYYSWGDLYGGGGIRSNSSTIKQCRIIGNQSAGGGGGVYSSSSTVSNCEISGNRADSYGGGIEADGSYIVFCHISRNQSSYSGGGIYASYSTPVRNCLVDNNTAGLASSSYGGGGIYGNGTITNTTVVRNSSPGDGAGVNGSSSTALQNCIVWGNERDGVANNINGSSVNCSYCAVEGGYPGTEMTLLDELTPPHFVNPSLMAGFTDSTINVDWHFLQGSPCVNAGDNSAVTDTLDLDGVVRIKRDTVDLGCYESDYYSVPLTEYDSIIYVTVTGSGTRSGNSWANAMSSIEEAQALSLTHNAVVWVAAGTYYGDTTTTSGNAFTMRDGVSVYGGFEGSEPADYDLSLRDFETNATILDGQNARRVLYQPFEFNNQTCWDGFTIRNGQTSGDGAGVYMLRNSRLSNCKVQDNISTNGSGGGVYCSSATIEDCEVSRNTCRLNGGGIHAVSSSVVSGCNIEDNTTTYGYYSWGDVYGGGGIRSNSSTIKQCRIIGNQSAGGGGGVYSGSSTVSNCEIADNRADSYGGGVETEGGYMVFCRISRNQSSYSGGGMRLLSSCRVRNCLVSNNAVTSTSSSYVGGGIYGSGTITNTTIVRNSSPGDGAGMNGSSSTTLQNCIVWGNERDGVANNINGSSVNCSYCAVEGGYPGTEMTLLDELTPPHFVNPSLTAGAGDSTTNVDWHLQQGSPCINRGDNSAVTDSLDLDGTARIKRDTVDLGCYETDYYSVPVPYCSTVYSEFSDVACDTYSWNGQTYTQSGNFIQSFELPNGCDSVVTLHLTVNHPVTTNEYLTVCASDLPYPYRDTMLDISTPQLLTITSQLLTQNGCDSTVILFLTVTPSTVGEFAAMTPTNNYPVSAYPIRFTWDAVENASNYDLYVWPVGEPQPQQPTVSRIRGTSYTLSSLANRSAYQWFMTAYNACDTSLSTIRQFTLNVTPTLTVNTTNPVDLGEVQLNGARSIYFQVSGNALDSIISHKLTGADSAAFTLVPTNSWDSLHGGRMQLTFHPTIPQSEYIAQMTFQSDNLVRTITVKGYLSDYLTFTTYVDTNIYAMDSEIPIHGRVINPLNEPVAGLQVEVYVKVLEYVRTFPVTSDANGQFTVMFTPQHSEAGYYTVGSRRAGGNSSAVHDEFNIPGMMLVSSDWIMWTTTIDQAQTGTIAVRNRSRIPLTNIQVTPVTLPNGCTVQFVPLNLASMATGDLQYTVTGSQLSTGSNYEEVRLNALSDEGAAMSFSAWYYCIPQRADLDVTPTSFTATMTRGQSKVVDFKIYNNGTRPTGDIYVSLPDVPWMSVVGSDTLPSLAVHDSAYVSIRLSPDSTIDLVRYTGNFAINCERGEGVSVPYSITAISDSTGTLVVDVTDEYTWNTNGGHGPHLAGASVTVRGYYSLETVATGVTDANGLFVVNDLPEGWYKLIVRADRHAEYQGTLLITAGDTNRQDIFIQFQAITYSWEVVPTEIQDEYTYELNVEFETHVPKPVVVLDMLENIPALEEGESFTFDYVLTNYGLVTTYDVQLFTPESSIYTFTPLIDHMDSLPAQSTQIIPCVMSRPVQTRSASMNRLRGVNRSDCPYLIVTKVLSYYSCAGEQRPIWAYVSRNAGSVPCHTVPNNSGVVTNNTNNPPIYHGGSGSYSWTSGGNTYTIPAITMPVDLCECQDEITRDTTIIFDMDTVLFINGTDDYNFVAFCDSCDSMVIICTTINNCITGEITYYCDTLSSLGPDTMGSGQGDGPQPPAPDSTNCELEITKIWGSGDSYFNQLLSNHDYEVKGVVADGTSTLIIRIKTTCNTHLGDPSNIHLSLKYYNNPGNAIIGTIIGDFHRISDQCVEFVYRAPSEFPKTVSKEYQIDFTCDINVADSTYSISQPILIRRVPVLFVHGLSDNGTCFDVIYKNLISYSGYAEFDPHIWDFCESQGFESLFDSWQLKKVDYSTTNLEPFTTNLNVIQTNIRNCFTDIVALKKFVVSKADIVGHSMGGILARLHVQYVDNTNVHKIITLNTPHSGSAGANVIMLDNNRLVQSIVGPIACSKFNYKKNPPIPFLGNIYGGLTGLSDCNLGAVNDLQVNSYAMNNILNNPAKLNRMNGIPVHAITTVCRTDNVFGDNWFCNMLDLVLRPHLDGFDNALYYDLYLDFSDIVVSLKSQGGGLPDSCKSVFGWNAGLSSWHSASPNYKPSINKIVDLLMKPTTSPDFSKTGFHPEAIDLPAWLLPPSNDNNNVVGKAEAIFNNGFEQNLLFDNSESYIQITSSYNDTVRQILSLLNYSDNMNLYVTVAQFEDGELLVNLSDTSFFDVPPTYKGTVKIYALGQTNIEDLLMDSTMVVISDYETTPLSITFVEDTLYLTENSTIYPSLQCAWTNGDTTYITPSFSADSSIVSIENGTIRGIHAGITELIAQFEGLTASIPVIVYGWDFDDDNNSSNEDDSLTHNTVCASVTVQFSQKMTMTREAFEGTLTINNGHESQAMQNIDIDFVIRDENGVNCTNLFQVNFLSYNNMSGTNGNASLAAQNEGSIVVQFIPTKQAAPEIAKVYSFGGSFSFIDPFTDEFMTYNLYPVDITVNPSPDLYVNYFMQRDIIGDDPLTEDRIEPIVPAELGVIIHNRGAGTAKNVLLETAEPKIIDNEKGLAVDFAMYGAAFNGNERQLGLMEIPFGNIEPDRTGVGEWWFTSTLLGHFVSYEAHVIHNNSFGNPDLSLVSSLDIHPLIHTVYAYGNLDDGINDFLVDDVDDIRNYPDSLYFSNGSRTAVATADSISFDHYVTPLDTIVILTLDPSRIGWNYEQTWDPGRGQYKLISCTRNSDQQVIPLSNVWQSHVTLPVGADPIYENKLHIVDTLSNDLPTTYTLVFSLNAKILEVDTILNVPDTVITTPLAEVTVVFNKPIVDSTFNYLDMSLKCNNGENLLDEALEVERLDSMRYKLHLGDYTQQSGLFVLNVQTLNVTDMNGFKGYYAKQANWIQNIQACVPVSVSVTETICQGETYIFHSRPLTTAGSYTDTLQTVHGCDSIVHLTLTVNSGTYTETTVDICGTEYYWALADTTVNQSGTYYYYSANANTCIDTAVLMLSLYQSAITELSAQICAGEVYDQNGFNVSTAGDHYLNLQTEHGCDSIVHLALTVNHGTYTETTVDTCGSEYYWALADTTVNQSGTYYYYSANANTCIDTAVLMLSLYQSAITELSAQICAGEVYDQNGFNVSTAGDHYLNLQTVHGCDSIVHLTITVNHGTYTEIRVDTCCTEYYWALADTTVNQSGTYYYYSTNANTCTDTAVLLLSLYQSAITELSAQICAGEVYDQNGFNVSTAGDHYLNLQTVHGCDSTVILHLAVGSEAVTYLAASICEGDSYHENGFEIVAPSVGTHMCSDTIGRTGTCDSIVHLTLTVNRGNYTETTVDTCTTEYYWALADTTVNQSGTYYYYSINANTCIDTTVLMLSLYQSVTTELAAQICAGEVYDQNGFNVSTAGDHYLNLQTAHGCDSIVHLTLTVNHGTYAETTVDTCAAEYYWALADTTLNQSGTYYYYSPNTNTCTDTAVLMLSLYQSATTELSAQICAGEVYDQNGFNASTAGDHYLYLQTEHGCDSTVILHLAMGSETVTYLTASICKGDSYQENGFEIIAPSVGTHMYSDTIGRPGTCDSIVHLALTVNHGTYTETTVDTCGTEYYWALADTTVNQSGTYYYYSTNTNTCTDTTVLILSLYQSAMTELSAQICAGEVYDQNGFNASTAGDHYLNLQTAHGCDSIVHLTLIVNHGTYAEMTVDTCGTEYYWALADTTVNQSGTYYYYSTNANTCIDTAVLVLSLYQSATTELSAQICGGEVYDQNGFNVSTAGDHYLNLQTEYGCDSTVVLHLTVGSEAVTYLAASICEGNSYQENGFEIIAPAAGVHEYSDTIGRVGTCDSIVHLTLTVNRGTYTETAVDTCGTEYYWALADTTVNQSGTYYYYSTNDNTCTDTAVLMLALYQSATTELSAQICGGEVYDQNGFNVGTAGDHYLNLQTEHGCDSTVILHLTVGSEAVSYLAASICEGDSYQENGFEIIAPSVGTHMYSDTIARLGTCDSVISLTLTVNAATSGDTTAVVNSSFDWYGQHLTTSGDYTSTLTNATGCDSVVTLHLTVNYPVVTGDTTAIACDRFDWYEHTNLTQSGDYVHIFTNIAGGDSVVTLHLTINHSVTEIVEATACDSYTWNGTTYTQSVNYTQTFTNASGCDSTITLHLTIYPTVTEIVEATACDSYTWNGTTYTQSGDYTQTFTNANGCDSVVTLHLTFVESPALQTITGEPEICINQYATYHYDISDPNYQYRWLKDNELWGENVPVMTLHEMGEGVVLVTMQVTDGQSGCAADTSMSVHVANRIAPDTTEVRRKGSSNILVCKPVYSDYGQVHYRWGYTDLSTSAEVVIPGDRNYCLYDFGIDTLSYRYWVETYLNEAVGAGCENRSYYAYGYITTSTPGYGGNIVDAYLSGGRIMLNVSALSPEDVAIALYDMNGKLLLTKGYGVTELVSDVIPVSFAPGIYLLNVNVGGYLYSFKLLKI